MTNYEFKNLKVNDIVSNAIMNGKHISGRSYRVFGHEGDKVILKDLRSNKIVRMTIDDINNLKNPIKGIGEGYDAVITSE